MPHRDEDGGMDRGGTYIETLLRGELFLKTFNQYHEEAQWRASDDKRKQNA